MKTFKLFLTLFAIFISKDYSMAQSGNAPSFVIPKGSQYSLLANDDNKGRTIFIHPDGNVWISTGNTLQCDTISIELPSRFNPNAFCWTFSRKLILFFNDTLFSLDNLQLLKPLATVEAKNVIVQPYGKTDIAFCAVGDTVIYQYEMATNQIKTILSYSKPITDFIVDDEDIFYTAGNRVNAFLKEKQYVPIFQNTNTILSIGFCGSNAMLFSDKEGLWIVDSDRKKSKISNQPIVDIVTDSRELGFFKALDGSWLFVSKISNYSKQ